MKIMMEEYPGIEKFNILNVDKRDSNLLTFLKNAGFKTFISQYEMILEL